jgi:hypothetical protein
MEFAIKSGATGWWIKALELAERWLGKDDKEKNLMILEWFEAQPHLGKDVHDAEFISSRRAAFPGIMGEALEFGLGVL